MRLLGAVFFLFTLTLKTFSDKRAFKYALTTAVDPVYGVNQDNTVTAVNLALESVNNSSSLLSGLSLSYGNVSMLECPVTASLLKEILSDSEVNSVVMGYSCSELLSEKINDEGMFNFTPLIHFTPSSLDNFFNDSNNISDQQALFSIHPSSSTYAQTIIAFLQQFRWQRLFAITGTERFFIDVVRNMKMILGGTNINLFEQADTGENLLDTPEDVRIIFLNVNSSSMVQHMCQAYSADMLFPRYVWITYARDFDVLVNVTCNRDQLIEFMDGVFTLLPTINSSIWNDSIILVNKVNSIRDIEETQTVSSSLSYYAIDAILALSQAINDTLAGWSNNSPDWSFCEMENELKKSSLSRCFLRRKIQNLVFYGLTGEISFDSGGYSMVNITGIYQYQSQSSTGFDLIARVTVTNGERPHFEILKNENDIFRGPIPLDGTPLKHVNGQPLALVIPYCIFASLGIIFSVICLLFNIIFRKRRIVKLISPNLNYFVILGTFILYTSVLFRFILHQSPTLSNTIIRCNGQALMTCVGYVLCFAPVLMKMWRVYYIFHNPSPNKKAVKDWHLFLGTSIIVGIIFCFVILSYIIPYIRSKPTLTSDVERPTGMSELGIRINNCVYQCYTDSNLPPLVWIGLEFLYMISLQVAAFILAVITRKVKIKVLNDFKEMTLIVYTTTSIMVVMCIPTFSPFLGFITTEAVFSGGIMLATTVFLIFLFIPKVIDLYRDPRGEGIFGKSEVSSAAVRDTSNTVPSRISPARSLDLNT